MLIPRKQRSDGGAPAKAFVSCSNHEVDAPYVRYIERILGYYNIEASYTVGRHDAAPRNPFEHMAENVQKADLLVIIATQRYVLQDLKQGGHKTLPSEMIHCEGGMAFAHNKPILVFAKPGVDTVCRPSPPPSELPGRDRRSRP